MTSLSAALPARALTFCAILTLFGLGTGHQYATAQKVSVIKLNGSDLGLFEATHFHESESLGLA